MAFGSIPAIIDDMNNVVGIGTDIVECDRIADMIEKHDDTFITRVFTTGEIAYCSERKASVQHFAGRWAAKAVSYTHLTLPTILLV